MADPEVWKQSLALPEYECSSLGRVRRLPHPVPMPHGGFKTAGGQAHHGVWDAKQRRYQITYRGKTYRIAPLICEAFHGPKPFPRAVAMHDDENSRNNREDNLKWGTQKENLNYPGFLGYTSKVCRRKMAGLLVPRA